MNDAARDHPPQPPTRRLSWLLTGSLVLNTLLVGLFIGQLISGGPPHRAAHRDGPPPRAESRIARHVLENVAPERRPEIRRAFIASMREARPRLAGRRQARQDLREAMVADPFDPDRLSAAFANLRTREAAMEAAVQAALVEQFSMLSLEERRAVAEAIDCCRRRDGRRGRHDGQDAREPVPETEPGR